MRSTDEDVICMYKNKLAIWLLFLLIISTGLSLKIENSNAENLLVSVFTNKPSYNPGENVVITVRVQKLVGGDMMLGVDGANVFVSIEPPGGGIAGWPAAPTGIVGEYTYTHHLSPDASGGVYKVHAQATHPGDVAGSDQTTFTISGAPGKKSVDWRVESPWISPANPTTNDPVTIYVWLRFATISPGPYPVELMCTVDGTPVGGGQVTPPTTQMQVFTPSRKYSAGTHTVTWMADPNFQYNDFDRSNNQVNFQFTVSSPAPSFDFSLSLSPMSQTIKAGQSTSYSINVQLTSGTAANVGLTLSGLPSGATYQFSPNSGTPTYSSTLTVQTSENTPTGSFALTMTGSGGGITKTATVQLVIEQALEQDFDLSVSPGLQSIIQGQKTDYVVQINPINDFSSQVTLSISGLPPSSVGNFNPKKGEPAFSSILEMQTTDSTPAGEFTLVISASGGGKSHETTVSLRVESQPKISTSIVTVTPTTATTEKAACSHNYFRTSLYL